MIHIRTPKDWLRSRVARYFKKSPETVTVGDEVIPVAMLENRRSVLWQRCSTINQADWHEKEVKDLEGKLSTVDNALNGIYTEALRALELAEGRQPLSE